MSVTNIQNLSGHWFVPPPGLKSALQFRCRLNNGLFTGKLGLIRSFRYHIIIVFWTLLCLRLIPVKSRDFLNQYLDKGVVHMLKIIDKSLFRIRIANCIHCAPACRCLHFDWYRSDRRIRSVGTLCYHFINKLRV